MTKFEIRQSEINGGSRLDKRSRAAKRLIEGLNENLHKRPPEWFEMHPALAYLRFKDINAFFSEITEN